MTNQSETPNLPAAAPAPAARSVATLRPTSVFDNIQVFEDAQRMARVLSNSAIVPQQYRGAEGLPNAIIAIDIARRMNMNALTVMQNLNVIHGRPSWSATFIIAAISSCGLFSPLRFKVEGEGDARSCKAYAVELSTGEILTGPAVSIAMAKAEGWYGRSGSKWPTMSEVMLTYRAASFFGRIYASHILAGLQSAEEVEDAPPPREVVINPMPDAAPPARGEPPEIAAINERTGRRRQYRPRAAAPAEAAPVGGVAPSPPIVEQSGDGAAPAAPGPRPADDEDLF